MINLSKYIGCIPLSEFKKPPPDQIGCELEKCPLCKKKMWVSDRKRNKRKEGSKLICWYCLFKIVQELGIDPNEIEFLDLLKMN